MGRDGQLTLTVDVDAVGPDGAGQGRGPAEQRVRVPGVLPGERVDARIQHIRRDGLHFGRVAAVRSPASDRRPASCPHFLRCGGCDFLHATIEWQRAWKRQRVATALGRPLDDVAPVLASPRPLGYRHLLKLVRGPGALLGSYAPRSHDVVDMTGCRVHAEAAERIAERARALLAQAPDVPFRYLLIRLSQAQQRAVATLVVRTEDRDRVDRLIDALTAAPEVAEVRVHVNDDPGDALLTDGEDEIRHRDGDPIVEVVGGVRQPLAGGAFTQVNPAAAALLYGVVVRALGPDPGPTLDLYSGSGGIALSVLAAGGASVVAVESHPAAAAAAREAAAAHGWSDRLTSLTSTVEAAVASLPDAESIVVNPPRKGLSPVVSAALAARKWRRLVYVSCNPDTLARDLNELGGDVRLVQPVDLFPQTRHIETVVLAVRDEGR